MPAPGLDTLVERLAGHRTLGKAPREELAWIAAHGELRRFDVGAAVVTSASPVAEMHILLSGRASLHLVRGGTHHKLVEWRAGDVTGLYRTRD